MGTIGKSLVATTLIAIYTTGASAQNAPATQAAQPGSAVGGEPAGVDRNSRWALQSPAAPADGGAARAPPFVPEPAGSGTPAGDGAAMRGGPENPSGLRKPD